MSWNISIITTDLITQDDIIRTMMYDGCYPEYSTVTLPSGTTYTVNGNLTDVARLRQTISKNIESITMFICDPV